MLRHQATGHRSPKKDLDTLLFEVLTCIAAILVPTGYGFPRVNKLTKMAFVRAANSMDDELGTRQSIARVAALTGLTRTDVSRMFRISNKETPVLGTPANRVARVASGWVTDRKFSRKRSGPRNLEFAGPGNTFTALVRRYSGDIPPKAILTEMLRLGMARRNNRGRLVFLRSDAAQSQRTSDALKAAIPLISFLARASDTHVNSQLTSRSDRIELKFSSMPQVFAAMRELQGRHSAFVAALEELGSQVDRQGRFVINVSVAVAATNPRVSSVQRKLSSTGKRTRIAR